MEGHQELRLQRATFKKRSNTLRKSTRALSMLCDIPALLICFGPDRQVITWPENEQDIQGIISRFRSLTPQQANRYKRPCSSYPEGVMHEYEAANETKRKKILSIDAKLQEVDERIKFLAPQKQYLEREVISESRDSTDEEEQEETTVKTLNLIASMERIPASEPVSEDSAPAGEDIVKQKAGSNDPSAYGQMWGLSWQWMRHWAAMNSNLQYPHMPMPLAFATPKPQGQDGHEAPMPFHQAPFAYVPFPVSFGIPHPNKSVPKRDDTV